MATLRFNLNNIFTHPSVVPGIIEIDIEKGLADQKQIAIIWSIEDVKEVRPDLTDDQAWEVLETVKRRHDADIEVNWDTLQYCADDLFPTSN